MHVLMSSAATVWLAFLSLRQDIYASMHYQVPMCMSQKESGIICKSCQNAIPHKDASVRSQMECAMHRLAVPNCFPLLTPHSVYLLFFLSTGLCKKACSGPVLRSIQRFGRLGRRSNGPQPKVNSPGGSRARLKSKDSRFGI